MNDIRKKVFEKIDSYIEEFVRFQSELVARPALGPDNGGQGETEKAELVETWCRQIDPDEMFWVNAPDDRVPSGDRPNLIAAFNGEGPGKVWVLSHLDIVPPGESSLWTSDPYTLHRDGDRIYGRGVEDNNHGAVSSYFAMKAIRELGLTPARGIGLIFVADEETGSNYGLRHVLETRGDLFSSDDLIIVPDAGQPDGTTIEVQEKSMLWLKFKVSGKQCHASTPHKGINTLRAAAKMITAVDEALPTAFDATDDVFSVPSSTFEPTKKDPNVPNINTVPGEDIFYFDGRVLPEYDLDAVVAEAKAAAEASAVQSGVKVQVEALYQGQAPDPTPADAPVVLALSRAVKDILGREARPVGIGGGTVAAFFREKGLPAAVWCSAPETAHSPDEFVSLTQLMDDAKVMAHVFLGF